MACLRVSYPSRGRPVSANAPSTVHFFFVNDACSVITKSGSEEMKNLEKIELETCRTGIYCVKTQEFASKIATINRAFCSTGWN